MVSVLSPSSVKLASVETRTGEAWRLWRRKDCCTETRDPSGGDLQVLKGRGEDEVGCEGRGVPASSEGQIPEPWEIEGAGGVEAGERSAAGALFKEIGMTAAQAKDC
jgi:hypothetical protein